jgi:hypothetical protein
MIFEGMSMRLLQAQQQSPRMPSEELKTRLESQLSRLICPIFSTGLSLSDFCGNGKRVMLSGTESFFETYLASLWLASPPGLIEKNERTRHVSPLSLW